MVMLSDDEKKPLGLKVIDFITTNIIWYLLFSLIYWDFNVTNWWLVQSAWGRFILIILEYGIMRTSFNEKRNGKKDGKI